MNDVSVGKHNAAGGTGYVLLGPSDVVGEVAFFTEVPQLEVCMWGVCVLRVEGLWPMIR